MTNKADEITLRKIAEKIRRLIDERRVAKVVQGKDSRSIS